MDQRSSADLHTHSNASDGVLTPAELIARARENGVSLLAITDHDTVAGCAEVANDASIALGDLQLINGIELSSRWRGIGIHVVGLDIDIDSPALLGGIAHQADIRELRAVEIERRLTRLGFTDTLAGARNEASGRPVGRPHFARYLVKTGQVKDMKTAFKKYLGQGKPGDVRDAWPGLDEVIRWVREAGGIALLAHPLKYRLTHRKLEQLVSDFAAAGGQGIEVVSGRQESGKTRRLAKLALRHSLLASCGSDFHRPAQHWADLGQSAPLPTRCKAVWEAFRSPVAVRQADNRVYTQS